MTDGDAARVRKDRKDGVILAATEYNYTRFDRHGQGGSAFVKTPRRKDGVFCDIQGSKIMLSRHSRESIAH